MYPLQYNYFIENNNIECSIEIVMYYKCVGITRNSKRKYALYNNVLYIQLSKLDHVYLLK